MVNVTLLGNELTDAGLMLQLPAPYVLGQLRVTTPAKPSCEAMAIVPVVPLLPTFTSGKSAASLKMKSGFDITFKLNDVVRVDAPAVTACKVTG